MSTTDNGHAEVARVKFGPRPNQEIPLEWAEGILIELAATKPGTFSNLLRKQVLAGLPVPVPHGRAATGARASA